MLRYITCTILLLSGCAAQSEYIPFNDTTYHAWQSCRVDYENTHTPSPYTENATGAVITTRIIFGSSAADNMAQSGPEMDKAIDECMRDRGFTRKLGS
jgi:hypothetical protein